MQPKKECFAATITESNYFQLEYTAYFFFPASQYASHPSKAASAPSYAGFFAKFSSQINAAPSPAKTPGTHEFLSDTPHVVTPTQFGTLMHAAVARLKLSLWFINLVASAGRGSRISSSVSATLRPVDARVASGWCMLGIAPLLRIK